MVISSPFPVSGKWPWILSSCNKTFDVKNGTIEFDGTNYGKTNVKNFQKQLTFSKNDI